MKSKWKFKDERNVAVFTTAQVIKENMPILYVSHDEEDGAWQFHCGEMVNVADAMIVSLQEIVNLDSTINELCELPPGWFAIRGSRTKPWIIKTK